MATKTAPPYLPKPHWASVSNPKVCYPTLETAFEGENEAVCPTCDTEFTHGDTINDILEVYCCWDCIPDDVRKAPIPAEVIRAQTEVCDECGGKKWYSDYKHLEDCSKANIEVKERKVCPECNGSARGRGFAHNDNCSLDTRVKADAEKVVKPPCDQCGGPARGRGFTHTDDCSIVKARQETKATKAPATPKTFCPDCGGPKRGRGYTHTDECKGKA